MGFQCNHHVIMSLHDICLHLCGVRRSVNFFSILKISIMIELVEDLSAYGQIESETFKFGVGKFP